MDKLIELGFDFRRPVSQQNFGWSADRRSAYLINPEVRSPVSVDCDVWPAVSVNADEGRPLFLWGSIRDILVAFPQTPPTENEGPTIIEIAVVTTGVESSNYWEGILFGFVKPERDNDLTITTECLGYDVADRYLVSGLSNCRLSAEEMKSVRRDWSSTLNSWGLFREPNHAKAFRAVCNHLIQEHAPFEVYRIRKVSIAKG